MLLRDLRAMMIDYLEKGGDKKNARFVINPVQAIPGKVEIFGIPFIVDDRVPEGKIWMKFEYQEVLSGSRNDAQYIAESRERAGRIGHS